MMDEAHVSGWYHSPFTIGPNPKPIYIGATLYSLAATHTWEATVLSELP